MHQHSLVFALPAHIEVHPGLLVFLLDGSEYLAFLLELLLQGFFLLLCCEGHRLFFAFTQLFRLLNVLLLLLCLLQFLFDLKLLISHLRTIEVFKITRVQGITLLAKL